MTGQTHDVVAAAGPRLPGDEDDERPTRHVPMHITPGGDPDPDERRRPISPGGDPDADRRHRPGRPSKDDD